MSADEKQEFPVWERLYQEREIEAMPWFNPELDTDLKQALDELGAQSGSTLDLGTGPGTQAMQLARSGFEVMATDISGAAIRLAREKAEAQGLTSPGCKMISSTPTSPSSSISFSIAAASTSSHRSRGRITSE